MVAVGRKCDRRRVFEPWAKLDLGEPAGRSGKRDVCRGRNPRFSTRSRPAWRRRPGSMAAANPATRRTNARTVRDVDGPRPERNCALCAAAEDGMFGRIGPLKVLEDFRLLRESRELVGTTFVARTSARFGLVQAPQTSDHELGIRWRERSIGVPSRGTTTGELSVEVCSGVVRRNSLNCPNAVPLHDLAESPVRSINGMIRIEDVRSFLQVGSERRFRWPGLQPSGRKKTSDSPSFAERCSEIVAIGETRRAWPRRDQPPAFWAHLVTWSGPTWQPCSEDEFRRTYLSLF